MHIRWHRPWRSWDVDAYPRLFGGHSCIVIQYGEHKKVLVVGGNKKSTEVFDVATQTWSPGADLPIAIYNSALVGASASSKYVAFLIGGWKSDDVSTKIYALSKDLNEWKEVTGSLSIPVEGHVALQLPKNMMEIC